MKNKIISFVLIVLIIIISNITSVLARFADVTDEETDKKAQEQIKEQEKEHNVTKVKSSDNYLTSLQVEGYTLTPEFDKQILEYAIKENFNSKELKIKATASNEKATINGADTVKVQENKNEYRVDVTAENGSVRTYIIKLKTIENKKQEQDNTIETEKNEVKTSEIENVDNNKEKNSDNKSSNTMLYVLIGVAAFVIVALIIVFNKNNRRGKRRKH